MFAYEVIEVCKVSLTSFVWSEPVKPFAYYIPSYWLSLVVIKSIPVCFASRTIKSLCLKITVHLLPRMSAPLSYRSHPAGKNSRYRQPQFDKI